jgi:hypothetical protein
MGPLSGMCCLLLEEDWRSAFSEDRGSCAPMLNKFLFVWDIISCPKAAGAPSVPSLSSESLLGLTLS